MAIKKIGHIANYFGLKGFLKVSATSSSMEKRFAVGKKVIIKNQMNEDQEFTISEVMVRNPKSVAIRLDDYNDINDIQWFIGRDIYANVRAPKGEIFYDDLVGMSVYGTKDNLLGTVTNAVKMPAGDYIIVDKFYVPFIMDNFIASVDKKAKKIVLTEMGEKLCE